MLQHRLLVYLTYNAGMGSVDLMDRKIYQIAAERPCNKYWMGIFLTSQTFLSGTHMKFTNKLIYQSSHARILSHLLQKARVHQAHSQWLHHCLLLCCMSARSWIGRRRGIALCAMTGLQAFGVEADTGVLGVALMYTRSVWMSWNTAVVLVVVSARPFLKMMASYYNIIL